MSPEPVARLTGVRLRYSSAVALDGVDLEIPAGRMTGLIGPDGVGKSSLLALISGARKIQDGQVEVLGGSMAERSHRRATCPRVAYMPQGLGKNLYPTLSVFENLEFFGRLFDQPRSERQRRIAELLTATGLAPFPGRPAGKLSGGMKQKLGLCCSLIHDPDLLILDEPTTGVDPLSRRQFWELIARFRARRPRMSVLAATAYFDEAERFDMLAAMDAGRILAFDAPAALKSRAGSDTLEEAFISLLPERKRSGHNQLVIPPRRAEQHEVAIEARGLTRRFGDFVAVDHVSFRISRGEIFGFLGSNGCGKTTTMKMLTGLLPVSEGAAWLLGKPVDASDLETRKRVGFMSQSFSLYAELSVQQNLSLHAQLFHLPRGQIGPRVADLVRRFELTEYLKDTAQDLPLGVRQRLSLAVAVIHEPEMLILDEPTSGVDPVARDRFWELLIDLSRNRGVTIFISTHFMNEAQRCDRISLMHGGKVLTQDTPERIIASVGAASLEDAFIRHLERASATRVDDQSDPPPPSAEVADEARSPNPRFSLRRLVAYARRETMEIARDWIRLAFALVGPIVLMIVFGYGISFDVESLSFASLDYDHSPESRAYLENYSSSRYFRQLPPLKDHSDLQQRLRSGRIKLAVEIPPGFGGNLRRGRPTEVSVWLDGAMPFRAETSRGYLEGVHQAFLQELARRSGASAPQVPANIEVRFRYNQDFKSIFAMVPGIIMIILVMMPAVMTALGVVREKELGSITNLYVTPTTGMEFLVGKQLPYVAVALVNFATLLALSVFLFGVPVKGSLLALSLGALLYVGATTSFGLLISSFVRTQIAAIFATAILSTLPAIQFSGFLLPASSMPPDAQAIGRAFPSIYFQHVSVGAITKALGFDRLMTDFMALTIFIVVALTLARAALRTQEA